MLFNSLDFLLLFPFVFLAYWGLRPRAQNLFLLAFSYFFYGYWDWRFLPLLFYSTALDYWCGARIYRETDPSTRKRWLGLSLAGNLGVLAFFKFSGAFAGLAAESGIVLATVLPIGISFYTFQSLSYTIDLYRREIEPTTDFLDFALFVSFFPQLVAGPIERASQLIPQVRAERRFDTEALFEGGWWIASGLFRKVVLADNLGFLVQYALLDAGVTDCWTALVALYAYVFQVYFDFCGYTDIARGLGRVLGFRLVDNFDRPFLAENPSEFWRKWHTSLSFWIRDYVYVPLGGSRRGRYRTYVNLGLTMLLVGIWHGGGWSLVLMGAAWAFFLVGHRVWRDRFGERIVFPRWLNVLLMFHTHVPVFILFKNLDLSVYANLAGSLATAGDLPIVRTVFLVGILCANLCVPRSAPFRRSLGAQTATFALMAILFLVFGVDSGKDYVYFQF